MKISIIGDTHLSHKNIQEYCDRPEGWEDLITKNLCNLEHEHPDLLIHLGDVSLGNDVFWHGLFKVMPFRKWLVLGNHDSNSITWYLNHGWDFVGRNFTMYYFGLRIFFSHKPSSIPPTKLLVKEKVRDVAHSEILVDKERSNFDINVCGHVHTRKIDLPKWVFPFIIEEQEYKSRDLQEFLNERNLINKR